MLIHGTAKKFWMPQSPVLWHKTSGGGPIGPSLVQNKTVTFGATPTLSFPVTLDHPVGVGSMLIVTASWGGNATDEVTGVSDDKGNTGYTAVDNLAPAFFNSGNAYILNVTNAPQIITTTISAPRQFGSVTVAEIAGVAVTAALDGHAAQSQVNPGTAADAVTSGPITTTAAGDLIYAYTVSTSSLGASAGSDFTLIEAVAATYVTEYQVQSSAGPVEGTFTGLGASDSFNTFIMAFKHV